MHFRTIFIIALLIAAGLAVVVIGSRLTPQASNPAFTTAVDFVNAAGQGDDTQALPLLDQTMRAYVAAHCPKASPAACVQSYTPPEWGKLVSAVFRRAAPSGQAWDVEIIANYQTGTGASGVCSLIHVAPEAGNWLVAGWAGFVHCGDPDSRDMATNPDTPNRAP